MTRPPAPATIPLVPKRPVLVDASPLGVKRSRQLTMGDADSLVSRFLPVARALACRYVGRGEPAEDLIQVANLGLVKAAQRYEEGRGSSFVNYATHVIHGELRRHFRDHAWTLHVPRSQKDRAVRVTTAARRTQECTGLEPTPSELARGLELSEQEIADAYEAWSAYRTESLDAPPPGREDFARPLSDHLGELDNEYDRVDGRLSRQVTMRAMSSLERRILYMRYVECRSQREIAARVGLSRKGVSRALGRILSQLDLVAA
jgi:RNA polymerase sigma-B factor